MQQSLHLRPSPNKYACYKRLQLRMRWTVKDLDFWPLQGCLPAQEEQQAA
jgi:hypothetical protein